MRRIARRLLSIVAGALLLVVYPLGMPAQSDARADTGIALAPGAATTEAGGEAPVIRLHNRDIVTLRANILGLTPEQRAEAIRGRIEAVLDKGGPGKVELSQAGEAWRYTIDGASVFFLVAEDFGQLPPEQLATAFDDVRRNLDQAVREAKELEDPVRLAWGAAFAVAATVIAYVLLRLLFWLRSRVRTRLQEAVNRRLERLRLSGVRGLYAEHALAVVGWLTSAGTWVLAILTLDVWLSFVLQQFPFTRPWGEKLTAWLLGILANFALAIAQAIPGLVVAVLVFFLARFVTRVNSLFLQRVERGQLKLGWLDADTAAPTRRISNFIVWLFALAMAYPYLPGADTQAFKGLSVLVGLMVSLGASSIIGQALSGLSLMYARSLRQGEYVKIGETEGTVTTVGMFATKVRTGTGEEVSIPNTVIVGNPVRNFSRLVEGGAFVMHTTVTIGYATPWRQVHAMLLEAARRTPGVADEPRPYVVQTALSDYYVEYRLVAQAGAKAPQQRAQAMNDLHANIQDVFNEHGVQIMSPHYVADPPQPQVVPPDQWYPAPAKPPGGGGSSA